TTARPWVLKIISALRTSCAVSWASGLPTKRLRSEYGWRKRKAREEAAAQRRAGQSGPVQALRRGGEGTRGRPERGSVQQGAGQAFAEEGKEGWKQLDLFASPMSGPL